MFTKKFVSSPQPSLKDLKRKAKNSLVNEGGKVLSNRKYIEEPPKRVKKVTEITEELRLSDVELYRRIKTSVFNCIEETKNRPIEEFERTQKIPLEFVNSELLSHLNKAF